MQSVKELLDEHLILLKNRMEESRQLMEDNLQLREQLQAERDKNLHLQEEVKKLRQAHTIDNRASVLSNVNGSRQTKAWIDRLVQEIDICLDTLNR
jgi:hypothetical protein